MFDNHIAALMRDEELDLYDTEACNIEPLRNGWPSLTRSNGDLGSEAEAESLGLNTSRIHPDIYMNELLAGMRVIHQVLTGILKNLA